MERGNKELHKYLSETSGTVLVHGECRRNYTVRRTSKDVETVPQPPKKLRSSTDSFNWKQDCFLCCKVAMVDSKHPKRNKVTEVRVIPFRNNMIALCRQRGDSWASNVETRLHDCIDLIAADARYHNDCYTTFRHGVVSANVVGRPEDNRMNHWFDVLCNWLENDSEAEMYTVLDLFAQMSDLAGGEEVYTSKRLKQKLQDTYGEYVFFADLGRGKREVVCFRNMASHVVSEKWRQQSRTDPDEEAERIIKATARIIREEIRAQQYRKDEYPTSTEISDIENGRAFLPPSLRLLMEKIIPCDVRRNSIGQAIVNATRPRSTIAPILLGVGVELDHVFGSRFAINELCRLGFSVPYDEVVLYKQSVIQDETLCTLSPPLPPAFTQWAADNVDHNVRTLDGSGTFHGMGIISMSTPAADRRNDRHVKRKARVTVGELVADKGIRIIQYNGPSLPALSRVKFEPIRSTVLCPTIPPQQYYSNILWQSSRLLRGSRPTPNWSGFMQVVFRSQESVAKAEVLLLPIIDLNPSDDTCIYSTLLYIQDQAERIKLPTACVTFDQPLWQKATEIITAKSLENMVCRLGGFHLLMSALGSIGFMMMGSGLEDALGQVYGSNAVSHMLTGKAISRALRGHLLTEAALMTKLVSNVMPQTQQDNLKELMVGVLDENVTASDVADSADVAVLDQLLTDQKIMLTAQSRTARLWFQYLDYIVIIKEFITSERLGDWSGHLFAVNKLLNLFAATGHYHYAKSARLYLQTMNHLATTHPWLYQQFTNGYHVVRRSNRLWGGLWTDLVIEQVMMRSLKSRGGLTRGRGITESVRQQWIYSMHNCASVHLAMTTLTGIQNITSEQHVELGKSRCERDDKDCERILHWFDDHDPFDSEINILRSLSTGLNADDSTNCDRVDEIGQDIQRKMDNCSFTDATVKRKDQVRTLHDLQQGIQVNKKIIQIDPTILFMRCTAIAQREQEDITPFFAHEMTAVPTALFKDNFMRKAAKADLANELLANLTNVANESQHNTMHVIDGGWLLHRVRWQKNCRYRDVYEQYSSYVEKYGSCCVVFDGYGKPSTKDHEHKRRTGKTSADVTIVDSAVAHQSQDAFLSNERNKSTFIASLASYLQDRGRCVRISDGDADVLIVSSAIDYARNGQSVIVVADDTDIFILLLYHWRDNMADVYIRKERKPQPIVYAIREVKIEYEVRRRILFVHAWGGCDTTSATFGHGKTHVLKAVTVNQSVQKSSDILSCQGKSTEEVWEAGVQVFLCLYASDESDTLTTLRCAKYMAMVARCNILEPQRLPPTARAAHFHSLRVHLQIIRWKTLNNKTLNALEWGWKLEDGVMAPIMTDLDAAPDSVLKFIRCKCKSKNPCGTNLCSCRKNGINCVMACGGCRGQSCNNCEEVTLEDDDDIMC